MEEIFRAQAQELYPLVFRQFFQLPNIVAFGLGYKVSQGQLTDQLSLVFSVVEKRPIAELSSRERIPTELGGVVTDVVETGRIRAFAPFDPRARHRPAPPGVSIAHYQVTAGTFGLLVRRGAELFVLSNNHVLAAINAGKVGDPIFQPGPADGGTANERIGTLAEFVPLDFGEQPASCSATTTVARLLNLLAQLLGSQHRLQAVQVTPGKNLMDAALARPDSLDLLKGEIPEIGTPVGVGEPTLGLAVQKLGRTTGHTQGTVQQIDVTVSVDYQGRPATFINQIMATRMSQPGDSGSGVLDLNRRVVGLLFAGSDQVTLFTPIQRILDRFGVEIVV